MVAQKLRPYAANQPCWAAGGAKLPLGWGNGRGETGNLRETTRTPSFETLISHCRGALTGNPPKALRTQMNQPGSHHSACPREFLYFLDQYAPFTWPSRARTNFPCLRARGFLQKGQEYAQKSPFVAFVLPTPGTKFRPLPSPSSFCCLLPVLAKVKATQGDFAGETALVRAEA